MSASREKKQRNASTSSGATEKQLREAAEARKSRNKTILYTVIGVVFVVLAALLILWNKGVFTKGKVAATVNGKNFTVTEVGYYYYPTANTYAQYGIDIDDATLQQYALDALHQYAAMAAQAEADGYTLSEEGKAEVEETIQQLKRYATQNGMTFTAYIRAAYGPYMTESILRECLSRDTLATEYSNRHAESLSYDEAQIQDYYETHADEMDSFTYSAVFINGAAASSTDEEGNTIEATDAEKTAAMSLAKATADKLVEEAETGDFETLAEEAAEKDAGSYATGETTVLGASLANGLNEDCKTWLIDSARRSGDITSIEVAESGYWVLRFESRFLDEESYGDVDVRHILIKAELAEDAAEPTDEAMDAAKAKAQEILDEFNAGDQTSESFAALAQEYSEDTGSKENGGLYEHVAPSTNFFTGFKDWIFADGRKVGDTGLVENTQSGQQGWHVMYLDKQNELLWRSTAIGAMKSDDMNAWIEEVEAAYPITSDEAGMALVG